MYPLQNWASIKRGYLFGQKTFYSNFHLGTDYIVPSGTELFAPFDGTITTFWGKELGNTLFFKPDGSDFLIRCGHLQEFKASGHVKMGTLIALCDHTGSLAGDVTHLHMDISHGSLQLNNLANFVDPEKFPWILPTTEPAPLNVVLIFQQVWGRPGAPGEINYFNNRIAQHTILDEADLRVKMQFWHGVVYPNGKYSLIGDLRWQLEKVKK